MLALLRRTIGLSGQLTRQVSNIPVSARPQLLLSAVGEHKTGAVAKITNIIFQHGGSVATQKKMIVEDQFCMLISVYLPPDAKTPAELTKALEASSTTEALGFPVTVKQISQASQAAPPSVLCVQLPSRCGLLARIRPCPIRMCLNHVRRVWHLSPVQAPKTEAAVSSEAWDCARGDGAAHGSWVLDVFDGCGDGGAQRTDLV